MSPSWRNRLYIAISPERISLLKLGRGLKPKLQANYDEAIIHSGKQPTWHAVLDRLTFILGQPEWKSAEVNIVLSNRLVRYRTISFSAQLSNYSSQEAYARHCMAEFYGAAAEQWELRIQDGQPDSHRLVSAVDRALLDGLRQVCATHKLELLSVTPYLMSVFNYYRKTLKNNPAWLIVNEIGYSLFALLAGGEFVTANGGCHDRINELPFLLDRENLVCSLADSCKSVYLVTHSENSISTVPKMGYEFSKLDMVVPDGFPSYADGLYGMAMSGAL